VVEDDYLRLLGLSRNGYNALDLEVDESEDEADDDGDDDGDDDDDRPTKKVRII